MAVEDDFNPPPPGGSTPTGAAVLSSARYLLRRASANVTRTIVLAIQSISPRPVG